MSIDSQILVSSIVGNSQTFSGAKPRILVYPTTLSLNGSEQRVEEFNSVITNSANFSTNPFLYVHGEASDSSIQDLPHTQAGNFATTFSGDVIVQGTLWASALRKSDGSKINLENLGYSVSNPQNTFALTTSPNSAPSADLLLDTAIKTNNDLIVLNQNSIQNLATSNQLSDLTVLVSNNTNSISSLESLDESLITSTGLQSGDYTANNSLNYLKSQDFIDYAGQGLTESLFNADVLLDEAIASNLSSITTNINNISSNLEKIDSNTAQIDLRLTITSHDLLAARVTANELEILNNTSLLSASNNLINNITTASGLNNQNYTPDNTLNFISAQDFNDAVINQNLFNADVLLDKAIASNLSNITTNISNISSNLEKINVNTTSISEEVNTRLSQVQTLQNSLTTEQGARVLADSNLQGQITSILQAVNNINVDPDLQDNIDAEEIARIDADLTLQDNIDAEEIARVNADNLLQTNITTNLTNTTNLKDIVDLHEQYIGLNINGVLDDFVSTNYIQTTDTIKEAIETLDTSLDSLNTNLQTNLVSIESIQEELNDTQAGSGLEQNGGYLASLNSFYLSQATSLKNADFLLDSRIRTNEVAISSLGDLPTTVLELSKLKTSVGTNADGDLVAFSGTTFLNGITVLKTALTTLDTAIANKASNVFELTGIIDVDKQNGRILQYVAEDSSDPNNVIAEHFKYVDSTTGPQGPSGNDGRGISSVTENNDGTFTLNFSDNLNPFTTINLTGNQGEAGDDGPAGISAYQAAVNSGFAGNEADWLASLVGVQGIQGVKGDDGEQGIQGIQGIQGEQGIQGIQGTTGAGITFKGSVADVASLPAGVNGDAYLVQTDDSLHIHDGTNYVSGGSIQGERGLKGEQGIQGDQGIQGVQGNTGADGTDADNAVIANSLSTDNDFILSVASSTSNIIGNAPDNTYSDGLFSSWTANTTISTVVDSFNEVLKSLAPSPSPYISDANIGANSSGVTGILTINNNTVIDANTYYAVNSSSLSNPDSPFDDIAKGSAYSSSTAANSEGTHRRLGVINGTTAISGKLNDSVSADGVNYPADSFGYADQGFLKLYVNDNDDSNPENTTIDLANLAAIDSRSNGTGFNITAASSGSFSNGDDFTQFKHRTGTWHVAAADQRKGWNFIRVVHAIGNTDYESQYVEWFVDADTTNMSVNNSSLNNLSMSGSKKISGVEYHTGGTAQYSISVANAYKTTYSNNSITFSGSNVSINSVSMPEIGVDDHTKTLVLNNKAAVIAASSLLNGTITANASIPHPIKSDLNNVGTQSISGILLYSLSDNATPINETFRGEDYRIVTDAYSLQSDVTDAGNSWNSNSSISATSDLLVHNQRLMYPTQGANSGNFSTIVNGPVGNVDYSSASGERTYFRKFQNNTTNSKTGFSLQLQGNGSTLIDPLGSLSASNIKVSVKLPETGSSQLTGFLNIAKDFETGQYEDNDGSLSGALSSNISSGQTTTNTVTFGQKYLQPNEYFVLRVVVNENWTGYLSNITVDWS